MRHRADYWFWLLHVLSISQLYVLTRGQELLMSNYRNMVLPEEAVG